MPLAQDLRRVRAIIWKDLTTERRSKAGFNAVAFLGVLILLLFGFALGPDAEALRDAAAGAVWLAILFSGVLAFNRSYQLELDGGALEPLLLYPGAALDDLRRQVRGEPALRAARGGDRRSGRHHPVPGEVGRRLGARRRRAPARKHRLRRRSVRSTRRWRAGAARARCCSRCCSSRCSCRCCWRADGIVHALLAGNPMQRSRRMGASCSSRST